MRRPSKWLWAAALCGYAFLYLPLVIVVVYSFNDSRLNAEWVGFTFDWYKKLFDDNEMLVAAGNSLLIGTVTSAVSTVLGTMAGLALHRQRSRLLSILVLTPIAIPEILMGVSLLIFFVLLNFTLGLVSVTLAHIAFCIGFVAIVVRSRLAGMDESLTEAARDCGATPIQAFRHVTLPLIMPGVIAGALMAFTLSIDDFVITFFTAGAGSSTLPLQIYSMIKISVTPEVNAVSTLLMLLTLAMIVAASKLSPEVLQPSKDSSPWKKLLVGLLLAFIPVAWASAADQLHLYNWNNYIAPETVKRFEDFCKCEVVQTYYSDNEELLAKLAAGAKGYDILVPTGNALQTLIKQGALKPIDKSQLPNLKNIGPAYLNTQFDPGNKFSVPYAMSITLIGYNDEKIRELGIPVDSWAAVFDPKILEKLKKRITVLDSANELFAAALKYLGYSANDVDEAHWKQAADLIKKAKPYWAAFNASSYIKELTVGNIWLVHGYSNDIFQANLDAQAAGRKFKVLHALPKEGAVLALDNMVIHKDAPRPDLALKFINFMLDGKNSAELTNLIGSGNPNAAAMQFIKPEIAQNKAVFPDAAALAKLEQLQDLNVKQRRLRNKLWTEIKAAR